MTKRIKRALPPIQALQKAAKRLGVRSEVLRPRLIDRQILQGMTWQQAIAAELDERS